MTTQIYKVRSTVADKFPGFAEAELSVTGQYMKLRGVEPRLAIKICQRLTDRGARVVYRDGVFSIRACRDLREKLLQNWAIADAPEGTPEAPVEPELLILDNDRAGTLERIA